jgi:cleavage and polyadenylation specificity factor subunit 3
VLTLSCQVPIYYASALAQKCMTIYLYYTYMMNERIREQIAVNNPFKFKHIRCVIMDVRSG